MNLSPSIHEREAIRRLQCGDLAGLEILVGLYQVEAVHSAYLVCGDPALAEDVAQAAFMQAARKIGQFDAQRPFRPWFLQIVVRLAVREARRRQRTLPLDEPDEALPRWLHAGGPLPDELAEQRDLRGKVWQAIQSLPPEERAVIVQRHFLEMSAAEMTASLSVPESTVKWRLHTARRRLRTLLSAVGLTPGGKPDEES